MNKVILIFIFGLALSMGTSTMTNSQDGEDCEKPEYSEKLSKLFEFYDVDDSESLDAEEFYNAFNTIAKKEMDENDEEIHHDEFDSNWNFIEGLSNLRLRQFLHRNENLFQQAVPPFPHHQNQNENHHSIDQKNQKEEILPCNNTHENKKEAEEIIESYQYHPCGGQLVPYEAFLALDRNQNGVIEREDFDCALLHLFTDCELDLPDSNVREHLFHKAVQHNEQSVYQNGVSFQQAQFIVQHVIQFANKNAYCHVSYTPFCNHQKFVPRYELHDGEDGECEGE